MKVDIKQLVTLCLLGLAIHGCGSAEQRNPEGEKTQAKGGSQEVLHAADAKKQDQGCQSGALGLSSGQIAGDSLSVLLDGQRMTLCQALEQSGKPVAIFQFAGILCLSCQEEAEFFTKALLDPEMAEKVAHIVIVTDFVEDFSQDEIAKFMSQYAPHAMKTQDDRAALWKQFSLNPALPTRPTLFAMNRRMEISLINEEGADYKPMLDEALALAP